MAMETEDDGVAERMQLAELDRFAGAPLRPIIEVAFPNGMWWTLPEDLCQELLACKEAGQNASYVWYWGENGRDGSYIFNGAATKFNRYVIDFDLMLQTNQDNKRQRSIRIVYARRQDVTAEKTGQIPRR